MIFAIGLLFFLSGKTKIKKTFKKLITEPFYFSVILFFIYIVISITWSGNFKGALGHAKTWMTLLVIPFFNEMLENKNKKKLYYTFLIVFVYISIWVCIINTGIINVNYKLALFDVIPGSSYIMVSFFLGCLSILTLNKILCDVNTIRYKIPYILLILVIVMEIFMLEARGGQLAFLFMLYVFIILINKEHIVRGFFISSLIVVLLFLAGYNLSYTFKSRVKLAVNSIALLKEKKDFNTSSGSRIGLWIVAKDMIFEKPLFGTGVGGYRNNFKKVFNEKHSYMGNEVFKVGYSMLHNEFLQIFVQFGLIGFILYLNIFYRFLKVALKNDNGFVAILFLSYYFVFVLTYVALERYQLLYTFVIMMPLLAYGSLCGKVN
jgi:O-antigen ligase